MRRSSVIFSLGLGCVSLLGCSSNDDESAPVVELPSTMGSAGAGGSNGHGGGLAGASAAGGSGESGNGGAIGFPSGGGGKGGAGGSAGSVSHGGASGHAGATSSGGKGGAGGDSTGAGGSMSSQGGSSGGQGGAQGSCPDGDGIYCGASVGGDVNTLYLCTGGQISVSQACATGCTTNPPGLPDACSTTNATSCPSGDGLYCGQTVGADATTLYDCKGGVLTVQQKCPSTCQVSAPGSPDQCASGQKSCPSGNGLYCGQEVNGDPNVLYQCTDGALSMMQQCSGACQVQPAGVPDKCGGSSCPSGDGLYCGQSVGGDAKTLYQCTGGALTVAESCQGTCQVEASGTSDKCPEVTGSCPGDGAYCGQSVGGDGNTLYNCSGGTATAVQNCGAPCQVNPPGTPDSCPGPSGCSPHGAAALSWEANQLATNASNWSDYCLGFVYHAYLAAGVSVPELGACDASGALANAKSDGKLQPWNGNPPCGAIVFWGINKCNAGAQCPDGGYGHVVISNGDGTATTSGWTGFAGSTHATWAWLTQEECGQAPAGYLNGLLANQQALPRNRPSLGG